MNIPLSIVILTKDEEYNLPVCLESISWCDDIHLIDSGSVDKTIKIAQDKKVQCKNHPFESFAKQRNWALDNCNFKYEWILFLDADERATTEFKNCLFITLSQAEDSIGGFYCCSKTILNGRWLKRTDSFPKWQFRLLRLGGARFIDYGHGQKEYDIKGRIGYIREPYLHYPFSKGLAEWRKRHNRYSTEEAIMRLQAKINLRDFFSKHGSARNSLLRAIVSYIPTWPLLRFCYEYFLKFGFLEGKEGFIYCSNMVWYELEIQIKMLEVVVKGKKGPNS